MSSNDVKDDSSSEKNSRRGKMLRQVIITPGEDGFWVAECPSLPGCISQGKSRKEAIQNIREAIEGYIEVLEEEGDPIPPA